MSQSPHGPTSLKIEVPSKKAYVRPRLVEYGSLAKLTQQVKTGLISDSPTPGHRAK